MDHHNIDEALVYHARQRDDSPLVGNEVLLNGIKNTDRLHGSLAILPLQTGEMGTLESLVEKMKENKIKAFRAFPTLHKYSMSKTALGPLYELMVERNIPLFISISESSGVSKWALMENILAEVPDLTLIVTEHGSWGEDRFFRPLIEKYENLHIDTSRYELDGGIKDFCGKYGAERLLFGTNYPFINPGGPVLTLAQADVTTKEKEMMASGNLERILGRVKL
jgi:predicted TIM-barrel fold metal-dependent hydrolase